MKKIFILICLMMIAESAFSFSIHKGPFKFEFEPTVKTVDGGKMTFELRLYPDTIINEIEIYIKTSDNAHLIGSDKRKVIHNSKENQKYYFDVEVPADDTFMVRVGVKSNKPIGYMDCIKYYVNTGDTLESYGRRPKSENVESLIVRWGNVIPGEFPEKDSLYGLLKLSN